MKNNLKGVPKVVDKLSYKKLIFHDFGNFDLFFQRNLGWKSEFRQSSGGKLNILFQEIEFKSLSIYHDIINIGFITSGIIPENKIAFYIPFEQENRTQNFTIQQKSRKLQVLGLLRNKILNI